jgi:hypothetical protein
VVAEHTSIRTGAKVHTPEPKGQFRNEIWSYLIGKALIEKNPTLIPVKPEIKAAFLPRESTWYFSDDF